MDSEKRQRLQAAGWAVGNTSDFLGLTPGEAELVELKVKLALQVKQQRKKHKLSQNALANLTIFRKKSLSLLKGRGV